MSINNINQYYILLGLIGFGTYKYLTNNKLNKNNIYQFSNIDNYNYSTDDNNLNYSNDSNYSNNFDDLDDFNYFYYNDFNRLVEKRTYENFNENLIGDFFSFINKIF